MKNFLLFLVTSLLLLASTRVQATTRPLPNDELAATWLTSVEDQRFDRASAEAFTQLSVADVAAQNGGKLGIGKRLAFLYAKHSLRQQLRHDRAATAFAAPSGGGGFGGGFALGFFLGLIGVIIALIIRDKKPGRERMLKGAWVGLGVFLILYIILLAIAASNTP